MKNLIVNLLLTTLLFALILIPASLAAFLLMVDSPYSLKLPRRQILGEQHTISAPDTINDGDY